MRDRHMSRLALSSTQLGLLAAGLVTTVKHRSDDARAAQYAALVEAEEKAKQERKGLHGAKPPPAPRINDLSTSSDGNRGGNAARCVWWHNEC